MKTEKSTLKWALIIAAIALALNIAAMIHNS